MKCEKCGSEIPEGNLFCTECGAKVSEMKQETAPKKEKKVEKKADSADKGREEVKKTPISDNVFRNEKADYPKPVGTVAFFFLRLLFFIPVIGLLASIMFSVSSKNENTANHARAVAIWKLIVDGLLIIIFIVILVKIKQAQIPLNLYIEQIKNALFAFKK